MEKKLDRGTTTVGELVGEAREQVFGTGRGKGGSSKGTDDAERGGGMGLSGGLSEEDQRIRAMKGRGRRGIEDEG